MLLFCYQITKFRLKASRYMVKKILMKKKSKTVKFKLFPIMLVIQYIYIM